MKIRFTAAMLTLLVLFCHVPVIAGARDENLALGRSYTVESDIANSQSFGELDIEDNVMLTDGVFGSNSWNDASWAKFYRAIGRTVKIDLGELCEINGLKTELLCDNSAGIFLPDGFSVFVSADGENYSSVPIESVYNKKYPQDKSMPCRIVEYDFNFDAVCGRYVALHFDVGVNCFMDEIQVFGKRGTNLLPSKEYTDIIPPSKEQFLPRDALGGDTDIILFHTGYYPDDESLVNNTESTFLPFIAYLDENKRVKDTMFDSVMFLILQGKCPSGGNLSVSGGETVLSDWEMLLDQYFSDVYNLRALDNATADMKEQLGLDDYTVSVYLTCPYPKIGDTEFGDYNGDGKTEIIRTYEDCLALTEWFVDECIRRFDENGYPNLVLKGFFCNNEGLGNQRYDYEKQYATDCCKIYKDRGLYCVMIPYYQAVGIEDWENIGFDAVLMQPNLSFYETLQDDPEGAMADFIETAKQYGMGIEMEVNSSLVWDISAYDQFYIQYLVSAAESGLMTDTVHAYYDGAGAAVFGRAAYSSDKYLRWFYDVTYKFIKGTLDLPAERVSGEHSTSLSLMCGEKACGETGVLGDWYCTLELTSKPEHGFVVLSSDGKSYTYTADRKYSGTDKFEYDLKVSGKITEHVTVDVVIEPYGEDNASGAFEESFVPNDSHHKALRISFYIAAAVISAAVIVLLILKMRKKEKKA